MARNNAHGSTQPFDSSRRCCWPVVVTSKDLTVEDRGRLNGGVERVIQKADRDETMREVCGALTKLLKRGRGEKTVGANENPVCRGQ